MNAHPSVEIRGVLTVWWRAFFNVFWHEENTHRILILHDIPQQRIPFNTDVFQPEVHLLTLYRCTRHFLLVFASQFFLIKIIMNSTIWARDRFITAAASRHFLHVFILTVSDCRASVFTFHRLWDILLWVAKTQEILSSWGEEGCRKGGQCFFNSRKCLNMRRREWTKHYLRPGIAVSKLTSLIVLVLLGLPIELLGWRRLLWSDAATAAAVLAKQGKKPELKEKELNRSSRSNAKSQGQLGEIESFMRKRLGTWLSYGFECDRTY